MKIFITGTDTAVGKTVISAWLCLHLKTSYWKPIQTGLATDDPDSEIVKNLSRIDKSKIIPEKYSFQAPASPHLASRLEGEYIHMDELNLPDVKSERLIVEGAGGILTPINDESTILSLIKKWRLPVIVVARAHLGTINHTCLTLEVLREHDVPALGVIMNGWKSKNNKDAIEKYGKTHVLDEVENFDKLSYSSLKNRIPSKKLIKAVNELSPVG